ncbi:MAG: h16 [Bradyrhizobium sp.]|nr:h16 [Bradyrhizobium sp.]
MSPISNDPDAGLDIAAQEDANPLLDYLGIRLAAWMPGRSVFQLSVEPRHLNRSGSLQGGVIATLLDAACGYTGLRMAAGAEAGQAVTVMLTISYLARTSDGLLTATGTLTTAGHRLYFASGELTDQSGRLIATAQGTFKQVQGSKTPA